MDKKELCNIAIDATNKSYSPYSGCKVGAALLTKEGKIYTGCNIENASYTPSVCAERTAISKAVSEGTRKILAVAVAGSPQGEILTQYAYPCGVCRQVMREFSEPDKLIVIVAKSQTEYRIHTLAQLFPESFGPENLQDKKMDV